MGEDTEIGQTCDGFLGGRLRLLQPEKGYRAGGDPLLLAAAVESEAGARVLDLGAGIGTAGLALLIRRPAIRVVALELQADLAALARENAALNGLADRHQTVQGDVLAPPDAIVGGGFDHILTNPPWHAAASGRAPAIASKRLGHVEGAADLGLWLKAACRLLAPRGTLTLIHRADRLDAILAALHRLRLGAIAVFPVWPRAERDAIRVIVAARRGVRTPTRVLPGLVLHQPDGGFTAAARAVFEQAHGLAMTAVPEGRRPALSL